MHFFFSILFSTNANYEHLQIMLRLTDMLKSWMIIWLNVEHSAVLG